MLNIFLSNKCVFGAKIQILNLSENSYKLNFWTVWSGLKLCVTLLQIIIPKLAFQNFVKGHTKTRLTGFNHNWLGYHHHYQDLERNLTTIRTERRNPQGVCGYFYNLATVGLKSQSGGLCSSQGYP